MKEDKPVEVTFTYSVQWRETDTPYEKRMDKYRRYQFLPQHLEASPQPPSHRTLALWIQLRGHMRTRCRCFHD